VLVVGPSGAGKDTVLTGGRAALGRDPRFVFSRREITRPSCAGDEDHIPVSDAQFTDSVRRGAYALSWQAHGLGYGLASTVEADLDAGRTVAVNASRSVIGEAKERYPTTQVVVISAPPHVLAARLAERSRETADDIAGRLARASLLPPSGPGVWHLDNDGTKSAAVSDFVAILREIDSRARSRSEPAMVQSRV